ncbi:MAG: hypothetical protein Q9167_000902 [Letrouitia subvulpina]
MQEVENRAPSFGDEKPSTIVDSKVNDGEFSLKPSDQAGVETIEAISQAWTKWSLIAAYIGIFLLAFFTSLEQQTTTNLTIYATSAFSLHSLVATVLVVQLVVNGKLSCAETVDNFVDSG